MITYDNGDGFAVLTKVTGSVLPGCLHLGCVTFSLGLALAVLREMEVITKKEDEEDVIANTFSIRIVAVVIGILLAVRTNMALDRWMTGISEIQLMLSKWGDAFIALSGFFAERKPGPELEERVLMFRVRIAHWFSLMSCLAFATLRCRRSLTSLDDMPIRELFGEENAEFTPAPSNLNKGKPDSPRSPCKSFTSQAQILRMSNGLDPCMDFTEIKKPPARRQDGKDDDVKNLDLYVLSSPTPEEIELLQLAIDKVNCVVLWIIQGVSEEIRAGTLDTPAPIVTRFFQELSNGMLGFNQAFKVAMVPFPFPFAQMVSLMLMILYALIPIYIDIFTKNVVATPILSFFLPLCYCGLNSVAIELEEPFGTDWNDVDIEVRHEEFLWMLVDVIRSQTFSPTSENQKVEANILAGAMRKADVIDPVAEAWIKDQQKREMASSISSEGNGGVGPLGASAGASGSAEVDIYCQTPALSVVPTSPEPRLLDTWNVGLSENVGDDAPPEPPDLE